MIGGRCAGRFPQEVPGHEVPAARIVDEPRGFDAPLAALGLCVHVDEVETPPQEHGLADGGEIFHREGSASESS